MTLVETINISEDFLKLRKNLQKQGLELVGIRIVSGEIIFIVKKLNS